MELMIKHSQLLTILIQALLITVTSITIVGCWDELIYDIKRSRKILKKGDRKKMRNYACTACGFSAWALDHIHEVTCRRCGCTVKTEPIPKVEKSNLYNEKLHGNRGQGYLAK